MHRVGRVAQAILEPVRLRNGAAQVYARGCRIYSQQHFALRKADLQPISIHMTSILHRRLQRYRGRIQLRRRLTRLRRL